MQGKKKNDIVTVVVDSDDEIIITDFPNMNQNVPTNLMEITLRNDNPEYFIGYKKFGESRILIDFDLIINKFLVEIKGAVVDSGFNDEIIVPNSFIKDLGMENNKFVEMECFLVDEKVSDMLIYEN